MHKVKLIAFISSLVVSGVALCQSLTSENLNHFYDPRKPVHFNWSSARMANQMVVAYAIQSAGELKGNEMYVLEWTRRNSYSQKDGDLIRRDSVELSPGQAVRGEVRVDLKEEPWLLVGTLTSITRNESWLYPIRIEKNYPVHAFLLHEEERVLSPYLNIGQSYRMQCEDSVLYGFYYKKTFPSALPPFSKNSETVDPILLPDSSFVIQSSDSFTPDKEGLYLLQSDTTAAEGIAFRVVSGRYPKYTNIEDLTPALAFICTKEEFKTLENTLGDKLEFDKMILKITRDKERAKRFIKGYYNRIELANQYFTSYKEGWKTDMGMIYTIFGLPEDVRKADQNEIWYYRNSRLKFVFVKKGSVYDPHNYVLMRDDRYTEAWYSTIDMWRKSRF